MDSDYSPENAHGHGDFGFAFNDSNFFEIVSVSAESTYTLQRKLVKAALSFDSSGGVQSSFSYVLPDSAVFQPLRVFHNPLSSGQANSPPWNAFWSTPVDRPSTSLVTTAANSVLVSHLPLNHNLVTNPFTSQATHSSSSSSSPSFTAWTSGQASTPSWPTLISGPYISATTATANSVSISPMTSGLSSNFNQPTTLFNPCVPSTQNCNGEITGIIGQISSSQITSMEQPSPAASPFGILPPKPQMFFEDSRSIQYGISSIPVKDKPAAVRYQLLTTRHLSRNRLPVRKYDPKLNAPKIPIFSDTKEIPVDIFVPRENPRKFMLYDPVEEWVNDQ